MLSTVGDTGKEIEAKKKALKKQKTKLEALKIQCKIAEIKYKRLERELAALQPSAINDLPSEVLLMILKLSICENHKLIRRLLLVCKYWRNLVVADAQMWNEIHLKLPDENWDTRAWAASNTPFVVRCLALSRSALLRITVNFEGLKSPQKQLADRLHSGFLSLPDENQVFIDHDLLHDWLRDLDYDDLEDDEDMTTDCAPEHVLELFQILVGQEGKNMERWESLELHFPVFSPELAREIWDLINHPIPNLSRACLYYLAFWDEYEGAEGIPLPLPDFSRVRDLTVSELRNWDLIHHFPPSITSLAAETLFGDCHSLDLPYFTNLTSLTLRRGFNNQDPDVRPEIPDVIALPLLEELIFIGYFARLHRTKFILPSLQTLVLKWTYKRPTLNLPNLQPKRVHWEPFEEKECKTPNLAYAVLRRLLRHFIHSPILIIPVFEKKIFVGILRELWMPGEPALALETVGFHMDGEIVETMKPEHIIRKR